MSKLVSTQDQAIACIHRFRPELDSSVTLQRRLPYARAWYAIRNADGSWSYGPSKFIGYSNMTAAEYVNDDPRDGRQTERKLASWFVEIDESDPLYEELSGGLSDFLAEYGKTPSTAMRINVTIEAYETRVAGDSPSADRSLADLIIAVSRRLPVAERQRIRAVL